MTTLASSQLDLTIVPQPDEQTCGPTSLHAVYKYHGDEITLDQICREVTFLPGGGTLAVYLGLHALKRGYKSTIYTCNVKLFDPTWFQKGIDIADRLRRQHAAKGGSKLKRTAEAYGEYLDHGGRLLMEDITPDLLARHIARGMPVLAGLSATWLYRCIREREEDGADDDLGGEPLGHFVVLHGVDLERRTVSVADPYMQKPFPGAHHYVIPADRVIGAIMLGIVTYDAKLLLIEK